MNSFKQYTAERLTKSRRRLQPGGKNKLDKIMSRIKSIKYIEKPDILWGAEEPKPTSHDGNNAQTQRRPTINRDPRRPNGPEGPTDSDDLFDPYKYRGVTNEYMLNPPTYRRGLD